MPLDLPGADHSMLNLRVVTKICELADLSRFLLPSLFSDLQQAACEGTAIVANVSKYGCEALSLS